MISATHRIDENWISITNIFDQYICYVNS